jgi:hypothetical protein
MIRRFHHGLMACLVVLTVMLAGIASAALPATNALEVEGDASKSTAGNWLANSDRRIKTDIEPITGALETLARVRLVDFRYTPEYLATHPAIEDRFYPNVIAQEFAFGTHPLLSNSRPVAWSGVVLQQRGLPLPSVEPSGDAFSFRAVFSRRKDREAVGLAYSVEFSRDLATWQTSTSTPVVLAQDEEVEVVSVPYPLFLNGKKAGFFRVRVGSL